MMPIQSRIRRGGCQVGNRRAARCTAYRRLRVEWIEQRLLFSATADNMAPLAKPELWQELRPRTAFLAVPDDAFPPPVLGPQVLDVLAPVEWKSALFPLAGAGELLEMPQKDSFVTPPRSERMHLEPPAEPLQAGDPGHLQVVRWLAVRPGEDGDRPRVRPLPPEGAPPHPDGMLARIGGEGEAGSPSMTIGMRGLGERVNREAWNPLGLAIPPDNQARPAELSGLQTNNLAAGYSTYAVENEGGMVPVTAPAGEGVSGRLSSFQGSGSALLLRGSDSRQLTPMSLGEAAAEIPVVDSLPPGGLQPADKPKTIAQAKADRDRPAVEEDRPWDEEARPAMVKRIHWADDAEGGWIDVAGLAELAPRLLARRNEDPSVEVSSGKSADAATLAESAVVGSQGKSQVFEIARTDSGEGVEAETPADAAPPLAPDAVPAVTASPRAERNVSADLEQKLSDEARESARLKVAAAEDHGRGWPSQVDLAIVGLAIAIRGSRRRSASAGRGPVR